MGELYERALLEMDDERWSAFEMQRLRTDGGQYLTGDPVVDELERALREQTADDNGSNWADVVKEHLGQHGG